MILDANVLLYARNASDPRHRAAKDWLERALNGDTRVGLPWSTLGAFLRIATNPRAFSDPLAPEAAFDQVESWLEAPRAWVPVSSDRYPQILGGILRRYGIQGGLVTDAMLAALAIDHGVALISTDSGFARFTEVRWMNPIQ